MKPLLFVFHLVVIAPAILVQPLSLAFADMPETTGWHAQPLGQALGAMALISAIGIVLAILGCKLFEQGTPGDLPRELVGPKNVTDTSGVEQHFRS